MEKAERVTSMGHPFGKAAMLAIECVESSNMSRAIGKFEMAKIYASLVDRHVQDMLANLAEDEPKPNKQGDLRLPGKENHEERK